MNSPNLLSALDLNTPRYRTRGSEFLRIGFHRTNYEVHEPMSVAMREFNEGFGLFDFISESPETYSVDLPKSRSAPRFISYKGLMFFNGLPNETKQETISKIFKGKCEEIVREKI
jgi:hypothetical protein